MKISSLNDIGAVRTYLSRVGAEPRSLRTAVVRETRGNYWRDLAVIRFDKDGEIDCTTPEFGPTDLERAAIKDSFAGVQWPQIKPLSRIVQPPDMIKNAPEKDIFLFRDEEERIIFVQVRLESKGTKSYLPWTYWDDDNWRMMEPDGALPLYNGHRLKDTATVFIHEGAKAARHVQWMVDGETEEARRALEAHPWGSELLGAVHLGWIGGAMSPYRTDWAHLKKHGINRAYIVADNDEPGREAVPSIARQLHCPTFMVQFTDEFPTSFDMADPFPKSMFGGGSFYVGPAFRDCLHPATWATDVIPNPSGKGRPTTVLRPHFKSMWSYIEEIDMFICNEMPEILRSEQVLNKMLAPFSHVQHTSNLIVKAYAGRSARICYRPDHAGQLVTFKGTSAINMHVPCQIKPQAGDISPFLEYMEYMFVNESERREALRWCATLIARPDIRMGYGLLLISEKQGVGKTTLGANVLAPLVGQQNVGYPSETDVTAPFNDWVAHKRLAIVSEIYSGSSWKAYHALKAVVTDKDITVNQKYMRQYVIENWCHVLASSNSMRALKMENDDRRWFYPEVTEVPWSRAKFNQFRAWLDNGGLSIIRHWAINWGDYVHPADRAPMTERKREMIEGSRSDAQKEAAAIAGVLMDLGQPAAVTIKDVVTWVRSNAQGRVFDSDYELRKAMIDEGAVVWRQRIKVAGRLQYLILNEKAVDVVQRSEDQAAELRKMIVRVGSIMEGTM